MTTTQIPAPRPYLSRDCVIETPNGFLGVALAIVDDPADADVYASPEIARSVVEDIFDDLSAPDVRIAFLAVDLTEEIGAPAIIAYRETADAPVRLYLDGREVVTVHGPTRIRPTATVNWSALGGQAPEIAEHFAALLGVAAKIARELGE